MTETATAPEVKGPPANLGEFEKMAWQRLAETIEKHNAAVTTLKAASGDTQGLIQTLRVTESDNPEVQAAQAQVTELDRALNDAITALDALLAPQAEALQTQAKEQVEGLTAQVDEYYKTIKAGQNYLKGLVSDSDALIDSLPEVVRLKTGGSTGGGSGQRRVRGFDFFVNGKIATSRDAKGVERSNLAAAAKEIGVETDALRGAFYQAQGTQDSDKFKDEVKFGVKHEDKTFEVYCRKHVDETAAPDGSNATTAPATEAAAS